MYGVCMCLDGLWVHKVSVATWRCLTNAHPALIISILLYLLQWKQSYIGNNPRNPRNKKVKTQEFSISALGVERAEGFTAFLAVFFSFSIGLSSYSVCLRFSFILTKTEILF